MADFVFPRLLPNSASDETSIPRMWPLVEATRELDPPILALASDWTLVLLVPAALILHFGVVTREERYLEAKFGESYRTYMSKVPRYGLPS